jgi:hypothetical protein
VNSAQLAVGLLVLALAPPAKADDRARGLDASVAWGITRTFSRTFDHSREASEWNGGLGLSVRLSYVPRRHPLQPFLDAGFMPLYRSDERVDLEEAGGVTYSRSRLDGRHLLGGLELALRPVQIWVAVGAYDVRVRSTVLGVTITPRELTMGYAAGVSVFILDAGFLRLGAQARVFLLSEIEMAALQGGLVLQASTRW